MTATIPVAVAPHFHLPGAPADRVLLADGPGWRSPSEEERCAIVPSDQPSRLVFLFALPGHLCSSFWAMLGEAGPEAEFDAFAAEVGRFLAFKELPPPGHAAFELVLHTAGGCVEPGGLWAVINLGDEPIVIGLPGLRVRLGMGEGARLPEGAAAQLIPPEGEAPAVLLLVRRPGA